MKHLSAEDVAAIHAATLRRSGLPSAPLRDRAALESALARPLAAAHYEGANLIDQAALLAVAISQAQAFLDGTKRAALQAMTVFLGLNGVRYVGDSLELAKRLEAVAERAGDRGAATDEFAAWLRDRVAAG